MDKIRSFERKLRAGHDISKSMSDAGMSSNDLEKWYSAQITAYTMGKADESFLIYNRLLIDEFLTLKRRCVADEQIKKELGISDEKLSFLKRFDDKFDEELSDIKRGLIQKFLGEGFSGGEIIAKLDMSKREFDDIIKTSEFRGDELSRAFKKSLDSRKNIFLKHLKDNDLKTSCEMSKITLDEFYRMYDEDTQSEFYRKVTGILQNRFLSFRLEGLGNKGAMEKTGIKEIHLHRWLNRSAFKDFQNENLKVTYQIILDSFKKGYSKKDAAKRAEIDVKTLNTYLTNKNEMNAELVDYYENTVVLKNLEDILNSKSIKEAIHSSDLSKSEVERFYKMGLKGEIRYKEFAHEFLKAKRDTYAENILNGKSHKIALRESLLTRSEYTQFKDGLEKTVLLKRMDIVKERIESGRNSSEAAKKAGVSVDEIYRWYFEGKNNSPDFIDFYMFFDEVYIKPRLSYVQDLLSNRDSDRNLLTRRDLEIWLRHDMIKNRVVSFDPK